MFPKLKNRKKIEIFVAKWQLMIFTLCGLAPITQVNVKKLKTNNVKFTNSHLNTSYNIVLTILIITVNITQFFTMTSEDLLDETTLTKVVVGVANSNLLVVELWILTYYYFKRLFVMKIANRIVKFDIIAARSIELRMPKIIDYWSYIDIFIHLVLFTNMVVCQITAEGLSFYWGSIIMALFVITFFIVQYALVLKLLLYRLQNYNKALKAITRTPKYTLQPVSMFSFKVKVCRSDELLITRFMEIHEIIYEILLDLAQFYSLPILMAVMVITFSVILSVYWLIMPFALSTWRDLSIMKHINVFAWIVAEMFPVMLLTNTVTKLNLQMQATKDILHKFSDYFIIDGAQKSMMEVYSLILNHRKVNFNAYYVVDLDNTLINKIFLVVITYVLIIVQFQVDHTRH